MNYAKVIEGYAWTYLSHLGIPWLLFGGYLILATLFGFLLAGTDKFRAVHGHWRVSEKFMFKVAVAGGCFGLLAGFEVLHHKYEDTLFFGAIMLPMIPWGAACWTMVHFFGYPLMPPFPPLPRTTGA